MDKSRGLFSTRVHEICTFGHFLLEMSKKAHILLEESANETGTSSCITKRNMPTGYIKKFPITPDDIAQPLKNVNQKLKDTLKIDGELDAPCKSSMKCKYTANDLINDVMVLMSTWPSRPPLSLATWPPLSLMDTARLKISLGKQ